MANFAIFVLGTTLWYCYAYREELKHCWNYFKIKRHRVKYIRKVVM